MVAVAEASERTVMMPHPVYIPTGEIRRLRGLLARREAAARKRQTGAGEVPGPLVALMVEC